MKTFGVKPQRLDLKGPVYQTELEILWFDHSAQCPPIPYTWRGIMESPWTPRCSPGRKKYANTASDFYFRKYLSTQLKYSMTNTECFYLSHVIVKQGPTRHRPMAHPVVFRYVSYSTTLAEHAVHCLRQCLAFGRAGTCLFSFV